MSYNFKNNKWHQKGIEFEIINASGEALQHQDGYSVGIGQARKITIDASKFGGGTTCPAPMTRVALINLRNTSALDINCTYVITDHVQGRLVTGTTITLKAVSANELSENVSVNTTYDNEAWRGIYDIDRAIVLELQDNRGNIARGFNGLEVANFDWGNTAYTNVTVDNASLLLNYGNVALLSNVTIEKQATVNVTNFTGQITNSTFSIVSNSNFTGANGLWRYFEVKDSGTFNVSGYTGGGDNYYNTITSSSSINFSNTTSLISFRNNTVQGTAISNTGVTTGSFTLNNSILENGNITHNAGAGNFVASQLNLGQASSITHTTGVLTLTRVDVEQAASINITTNIATTNLTDTVIRGSSQITNRSVTNLTVTRTILESISNIIAAASSAGAMSVSDTRLFGSGSIQKLAGSTAGTMTVNGGTVVNSNGFIYHNGTGNLTVTQSEMSGSSRIYVTAGNRNYSLTRVTGKEVAQVVLNGTGAGVTDTIFDTDVTSRGGITFSATGATTNNLQYSIASGLSGAISIIGTSASQTVQRVSAIGGSVTINNCSVAMVHDFLVTSGSGTITIQNLAVAKPVSYATTSTGSSISVTGTVAGGVTRLTSATNGSISVSGTAGNITSVDTSEGAVAINGGANHLNITKRMNSTLTTGNFTTSNIIHISNVNKTLTANNAGRADYLGVVSSVPLI